MNLQLGNYMYKNDSKKKDGEVGASNLSNKSQIKQPTIRRNSGPHRMNSNSPSKKSIPNDLDVYFAK